MNRFFNKLMAKLFTKFPTLLEKLVDKSFSKDSESNPSVESIAIEAELKMGIPWTALTKPLKECRIAIITTAGVHLKTDKPFDMENSDGDASFRVIPSDTIKNDLKITHDYYDHSDADIDINLVFPIERLLELVKSGEVGSVSKNHFGFMGHIMGGLVSELINKSSEHVLKILVDDNVDCVLLVPG